MPERLPYFSSAPPGFVCGRGTRVPVSGLALDGQGAGRGEGLVVAVQDGRRDQVGVVHDMGAVHSANRPGHQLCLEGRACGGNHGRPAAQGDGRVDGGVDGGRRAYSLRGDDGARDFPGCRDGSRVEHRHLLHTHHRRHAVREEGARHEPGLGVGDGRRREDGAGHRHELRRRDDQRLSSLSDGLSDERGAENSPRACHVLPREEDRGHSRAVHSTLDRLRLSRQSFSPRLGVGHENRAEHRLRNDDVRIRSNGESRRHLSGFRYEHCLALSQRAENLLRPCNESYRSGDGDELGSEAPLRGGNRPGLEHYLRGHLVTTNI